MNKKSCAVYPKVNNQDSKMYRDLLRSTQDRPFVNWVYAVYYASDIGTAMDGVTTTNGTSKYKRNSQGEHRADDVRDFLEISKMEAEFSTLHDEELRIGVVDNNGNRKDFTDAKDALQIAYDFNDKHKGLVANVYKHGNAFNVVVAKKNALTFMYPIEVKERLQVWDVYKQVFNANNIDLEALPQEVKNTVNPYSTDLVQYLKNLHNSQFNNMYRQNSLVLFYLNANSPLVKRLGVSFGSLENAAQAIDNIQHGNYQGLTQYQVRMLMNAVHNSVAFNGIDLNALDNQVTQMTTQIRSQSDEKKIEQTLYKLNKKYNIGINEAHVISNKITTLSEAAQQVVINLQRQIREIEKNQGNTAEGKKLSDTLNQLQNEIAAKRYSAGILNFLMTTSSQLCYDPVTKQSVIDNMLKNTLQVGTPLEIAFDRAKTLQHIKDLYVKYYPLLKALADEHTAIDESISQTDIDNIRKSAKLLQEHLKNKEKEVNDLIADTMTTLLTEIVGDKTPDGMSIRTAIEGAQKDSTIFDFLYSIGRASNPIIGAMGTVIRNAQDSRDSALNNIAYRIRVATDKLHKAKSNSKFMYADSIHIISDIDWAAYEQAMKHEIKRLRKQHLKGWDFTQALKQWEENNTEERVVDNNNGRTERVPNSNYRNNLATWDSVNNKMIFSQGVLTQAQEEYYNTMMKLKGEIGSLLPSYAQKQYYSPQIRRNMTDALLEVKSFKDVKKALKTKAESFYKIREDDTDYNLNGQIEKQTIDGQDYTQAESDYDNSPLRNIPIFFINKVEEGELLKEFSTGLQHLAASAINYHMMNSVADVVEFMGDFASTQAGRSKNPKADTSGNDLVLLTYDLYRHGKNNSNTQKLVEGFIAQHIFGQKLDPEQYFYSYAKQVSNIIAYTSFKGLATNLKGAITNYLVGEFQMLIEAGCGEFYGFKNYLNAHAKLFGNAGVPGEISDLLTNNMNSKATLFREMFDPINENFTTKGHKRYYNSMFRQLISKDCSFIGYASGEYLIHYVNMYAILDHQKVLLNGKKISLYDAFEKTTKQDGNTQLVLKQGVTTLKGEPLITGDAFTQEWLEEVRKKIRYANHSTHGAMNEEDKGLIHQNLMGRAVMNFRQWMVEHYSRRFRGMHFDATLGEMREGYWLSFIKMIAEEETQEAWKEGHKGDALVQFMKDMITFTFRAQAQWDNLNDMQKANVKRVQTEMLLYVALLGLSFALGEPDEHKREVWKRWSMYITRRIILDFEASSPVAMATDKEGMPLFIPVPFYKTVKSNITLLQSPVAGVNTINSLLYIFGGLLNGDITDTIKSGDHKGENRYWRNVKKYAFPVYKDIEQMEKLSEDESIFQIFKDTPSNY